MKKDGNTLTTLFSLEQNFPKSDDFRDAPPKTKRNGGAVPFGILDPIRFFSFLCFAKSRLHEQKQYYEHEKRKQSYVDEEFHIRHLPALKKPQYQSEYHHVKQNNYDLHLYLRFVCFCQPHSTHQKELVNRLQSFLTSMGPFHGHFSFRKSFIR